jgi:hypothetical protein
MACPVCNTPIPTKDATTCATCNWYFPLKDTPHIQLELSIAKQQIQMVNSFQQVFQHMQIQSKMLEKMSFRLDGMENEIATIKEKSINQASDALKVSDTYLYPELEPIMKAEDFDTIEKRAEWWNGLEEQWQKAFRQAVLQKSQYHEPNDEDYQFILDSEILRLVGPRGMHPSIDFELTNLSGLKHLTKLTILVASQNTLTNLEGIEHLENLESLFVNSNKLTSIKEVHYLPQLKKLYCNANQITEIQPIQKLLVLDTLYCCYNQLVNFEGITATHAEKLKDFVCLPNDKITPKEIQKIENIGIFCKKG